MPRGKRPGSITVTAVSFESMAVDETTLAFRPPLSDRAPSPGAFEFWWKLLQFVFELPSPTSFPALVVPPSDEEIQCVRRYIAAAGEMAESELLSGDDSITVKLPDDGEGDEQVEANFTSNEVTRGFTVLFRQFDSPKEPAGFVQLQRILRLANEASNDERAEERKAQLNAWRRARGRLRTASLKVLVGRKLRDQGRLPGEVPGEHGMSPEQLISAYQYGDLIHWGDKRTVLEAVVGDPFHHAWQRMAFLDAVTGLTHLYLGFAELAHAAIGDAT